MNNNKGTLIVKRILKIILLISWMILIFMLSHQNGSISSKQSDGLVRFTNKIIGIDKHVLVVIVRKLAHVFEYLVLSVLFYTNLTEYKNQKILIHTFIFSVTYAIFDEFHQIFIYERSGSITDIIIDILGIILGVVTLKLYNRFINRQKK